MSTQQQIEEIANRYEEATNRDRKFFIEAMTEATQPLLERVKELEESANNGDTLMNKQLERIEQLQSQLTTLEAACAEKDEALKAYNSVVARYLSEGGVPDTTTWNLFVETQQDGHKAMKSTSGQRILEENGRMKERIEHLENLVGDACVALKTCDHYHGNCSANDTWWFDWERVEAAKKLLSTNQHNQ